MTTADAYTRTVANCTTCQRQQPIVGGGLCRICYSRAYRQRPEHRKKAATVTTRPPGKPISGTDHERRNFTRKGAQLLPDQRTLAVRFVASRATDADDLTQLLDALGLQATEGRP